MLEHNLGHVGARLQITALLTREEIPFRANDGAAGESIEKTKLGLGSVVSHGSPPEIEGCSSLLAYTIHRGEKSRCPHRVEPGGGDHRRGERPCRHFPSHGRMRLVE